MHQRIAPIVLALAAAAHATDVYQNSASPTGAYNLLLGAGQSDSVERGNQITLGSTDRIASTFTWILRPAADGVATFDYRVRFYANDGAAGAPGTLLWDSGPVHQSTDAGPDMSLSLAMPPIRLPSTFTWTVQITGRTGIQNPMGPANYSPPTIGSALPGYWQHFGNDPWSRFAPTEPPFGATVFAVWCYADCDLGATLPRLNVLDFACFINRFAVGDLHDNCDGSTTPPVLNVLDFTCFLNAFAAGCSS